MSSHEYHFSGFSRVQGFHTQVIRPSRSCIFLMTRTSNIDLASYTTIQLETPLKLLEIGGEKMYKNANYNFKISPEFPDFSKYNFLGASTDC